MNHNFPNLKISCNLKKFKNFIEALAFVNKVRVLAEKEQHHLNVNFTWGLVKISIQTHKINGLCKNDFIDNIS